MLNPYLLDEHPEAVRWFVFYHECGHFSGGASELAADRYAMERGLGEGWFDKKVLAQVCQSFGDTDDLPVDPSGRRRCRSLKEHFEKAMASHKSDAPESKIVSAPSTATVPPPARTWAGTRSAVVPLPVARPPLYDTRARSRAARARPDPIGELIEKLAREGRGEWRFGAEVYVHRCVGRRCLGTVDRSGASSAFGLALPLDPTYSRLVRREAPSLSRLTANSTTSSHHAEASSWPISAVQCDAPSRQIVG